MNKKLYKKYGVIIIILLSSLFMINKLELYDYKKITNYFNISNKKNPRALFESDSLFHPKIGNFGAVATQESNATQVGIDILKKGGNAIDAAVAIGYSLAVTLPRAGNLGGGGFMTIWLNKEQKAYIINYREKAPQKIDLNELENIDRQNFITSAKSSGIPGTVAGLNLALNKFGTMELKETIQPAIDLAQNGFELTSNHINALDFAKNRLLKDKQAKDIFYNNQEVHKLNYILKQQKLAETLSLISQYGNDIFYDINFNITNSGSNHNSIKNIPKNIAQNIINTINKNNGYITAKDLKNYQAEIVEPIISTYKNYTIISPPPPSTGGVVLSEILNIFEAVNNYRTIKNNNSAEYYHVLTEIFNYAYKDRNYELGDPKFYNNNIQKFISKDYAQNIANKIDLNKHTDSNKIDTNLEVWQEGDNTTHFVVIDKDLNVVSNTYSLNFTYGNGIMVENSGFFLNNQLDDFTLKLGTPNAYGLIQGEKNMIAPNKQPLSSMTPIIILDENNKPYIATGTPGGSRIITTLSQVLLNTLYFKQDIATAVAMPRIHSQLWPDQIYYENLLSIDSLDILNNMGHKLVPFTAMGSVQTVAYNEPYYYATSDPRRATASAMAY